MYSATDSGLLLPSSSAGGERRRRLLLHCLLSSKCAPAAILNSSFLVNTAMKNNRLIPGQCSSQKLQKTSSNSSLPCATLYNPYLSSCFRASGATDGFWYTGTGIRIYRTVGWTNNQRAPEGFGRVVYTCPHELNTHSTPWVFMESSIYLLLLTADIIVLGMPVQYWHKKKDSQQV